MTSFLIAGIAVLAALCLFGSVFIYTYILFLKEKELGLKVKELEKKQAALINDNQKQAEKLLTEAAEQARGIILEAKKISDNVQTDLKANYQEVIKEHRIQIDNTFKQLAEHNTELIKKTEGDYHKMVTGLFLGFRNKGEKALSDFTSVVNKDISKTQHVFKDRIDKDLKEIKKTMEKYQKEKLKDLS